MNRSWISIAVLALASPAVADTDPCAVDEPATAVAPRTPGLARVRGAILAASTKELAIGATIVAVRTDGTIPGEQVAITDERGEYALDLAPGAYTITLYYNDGVTQHQVMILGDTTLQPLVARDESRETGCLLLWIEPHGVDFTSTPRFGLWARRPTPLVSRDRTHRGWIAPAAAADPRTSQVMIDGGTRLQSAPGIPLAFLETVTTYTLRTPITTAAGPGGGTDVALRYGTNELHGDVHAVIDLDRDRQHGLEGFAGGPLIKDHWWLGGGLVTTTGEGGKAYASGMATTNVAITESHQVSGQLLGQALADGTRDDWANARWLTKLLDNRLEIQALVTAERLALPEQTVARAVESPLAGATVDRTGAKLQVTLRAKLLGYHTLTGSAVAGGGTRGELEHADGSFALGDSWQIRPNLQLDAGVRSELRQFAGETVQVTSPRASLTYDPTQEGRGDVFVAYQRVPRLDEGLPGDWVTAPVLAYDELAAGASYEPTSAELMFGAAVRTRWLGDATTKTGIETWVRYEHHELLAFASATSLDQVGALGGQFMVLSTKRHALRAGTTARVSPDKREHAAVLAWKYGRSQHTQLDTTLEGFAGTEGPGARVLLGARW
ncbi:MAG: hypothetical protein ABI867_22995 [Kofleriaceae bacterium]